MRGILIFSFLVLSLYGCSHPATQNLTSPEQDATYASAKHSPTTGKPFDYPAEVTPHRHEPRAANSWSPKAAAAYLDQREVWWASWDGAARDHHTFCVSCHTVVPYALARSALAKTLGEEAPTPSERRLIADVQTRVLLWKQMQPYYDDAEYGNNKAFESRGTESVLNALILASYDNQTGQLSPEAETAFDNMWSLQQVSGDASGAWPWLRFDLAPWEAGDSQYYGAALAALAVGTAPGNYRDKPEIQKNISLLRDYLRRQYSSQDTLNRIYLLWASTKLPGLLTLAQQKSIVDEVFRYQREDGGWNLSTLAGTWRGWSLTSFTRKWKRKDSSSQDVGSDPYVTALATFALRQAGAGRNDNDKLKKARSWLMSAQSDDQGLWLSYSLNKRRDPSSNVGRFMSDAATAFAVLALIEDHSSSEAIQVTAR